MKNVLGVLLILSVLVGGCGGDSDKLVEKAKEAAEKCAANPQCKQAVVSGVSGAVKMVQDKG